MKRMKKSYFFVLGLLLILFTSFLNSCKKEDEETPIYEPIHFITPDTNWFSATQGEVIPLEIRLTTDRPIDTFFANYNIDSLHQGFDYLNDTSVNIISYSWSDSNNVQTYTGEFTVPSDTTLEKGDVVRLWFRMQAEDLTYDKILRIDLK